MQAFPRLTAQLIDFVFCKFGQDRVAQGRFEGTTLRDFDCIFDRLRQIREKRDHLACTFEIMLGCQTPTWLLLVDIGAFCDAQKRVMGFIHFRVFEKYVVCRHDRKSKIIGEINENWFTRSLCRWQAPIHRVALQFNIKTVFKNLCKAHQ